MRAMWTILLGPVFSVVQVGLCPAAEVKLSDGDPGGDRFGRSVSISGDYAIVGAYLDDAKGTASGSAYIFYRNEGGAGNWGKQAKLTAGDGAENDNFGWSVSISGDYVVVGAYGDDDNGTNSGSAYIFYRNEGGAGNWGQQAKLTAGSYGAADDRFGWSVGISGDYVIVGAYLDDIGAHGSQGSAYIFHRDGTTWNLQTQLIAGDGGGGDYFGYSVAISGDYAIVGAYHEDEKGQDAGAAYIFYNGTTWAQQAKLTAGDGSSADEFGWSVGISGDYAIVGAHYDDDKGTNSGSAYIFHRSGTTWAQQTKLTADDGAAYDYFGHSVAISGDYVIVGANYDDIGGDNDRGSAYAFLRDGANWPRKDKQTASDGAAYDWFGCSVSISDDYAIIGAEGDDDDSFYSGSAYIYDCVQDLSLPVELVCFTAIPGKGKITLRWTTQSEVENAGFNIYRSLRRDGDYRRINLELIGGKGSSSVAHTYSYTDVGLTDGVTYWYKLESLELSGVGKGYGPISAMPWAGPFPDSYPLLTNYPNPFKPRTVIEYSLPKAAEVSLRVYDSCGRLVRVLEEGGKEEGWHSVVWDGLDLDGREVGSGVYIYMLRVGDLVRVGRMTILR